MNITDITNKVGANPKRWRVGRGEGSGSGKTSGRGNKGSGQRAGNKKFELYEGGNFPFFRRIPKFGFSNYHFRKEYQVVNVSSIEERFDNGAHVTPAAMQLVGLVSDAAKPVKVLGDGELKKKLTIDAHRFTGSAIQKIEAAGGKVNWLGPKPKKKFIKRPKPAVEAARPEGKAEGKAEGKSKPEGKSKSKAKSNPEAGEAPASGEE